MTKPLRGIGLALALLAAQAQASVTLDGRLDEPEWQQAQVLEGFKVTEPLTLEAPAAPTRVLVLADADGLYVGFLCDQPEAERVRSKGQRDQGVSGDRVTLMLDFEGNGTTAYEFTAYLGGAKVDSIVSRQIVYNYDWDGDWNYAVSETPTQWFVEYRIPWTIAPMGAAHDGKRALGIFVSRFVTASGRRASLPANSFNRPTFVSDMRRIEVPAFSSAQLDVFPYLASSRDVLSGDEETRAGFDALWKPNGQHQLNATLYPDFGQVESDQLVVNFSAIPTLFPDKRPFFTENLDLFSTDGNVLYTRRIGAAPDCIYTTGCARGASEILGAVKYTGASGTLNYGALTAIEEDTDDGEGRDFYVARVRDKLSEHVTLGWIGTHVERPELGRRADVNGVDMAWTFAPGVLLNAMGLATDVDGPSLGPQDPTGRGYGGRAIFRYAPGGSYEHITALVSRGEKQNINDAGFQGRPSEHVFQSVNSWFWRDWPQDSALQEQSLFTNLVTHRNDHGDLLQSSFVGTWQFSRRDSRAGGIEYDLVNGGGVDDLITRGNGNVRLPVRHQVYPYWVSSQSGVFRTTVVAGAGTGYFAKSGFRYLRLEPGLYPSDRFSIVGNLAYTRQPDEIIWQGPATTNLLGAFDYEEFVWSGDINWFPVAKHELRVKLQWVSSSGAALAAYRPDADGHLGQTADPVPDFAYTQTAQQLRYRWEFAPLSELFLVYSHGGEDFAFETERSGVAAFRRGLAEETDSRFLAKLRWRFAVL